MFGRDDNKVRVSNAQISTFIGPDTTVEGKVITSSSIRIDGTVIGGVIADGTVVLSECGQIQGNVMAENIVVSGLVDGNMEIRDKVNIEPTGEVYGDITTCKILVDEESIFQGKCNMNRNKEQEKKRRKLREAEPVVFAEEELITEEIDKEDVVLPKNKKNKRKNINTETIVDEIDDDPELDEELVTIDISE